jgi:hypothetical protein
MLWSVSHAQKGLLSAVSQTLSRMSQMLRNASHAEDKLVAKWSVLHAQEGFVLLE